MPTERVRRGAEDEYATKRSADGVIYSPDLENKSGFSQSRGRELHVWIGSSFKPILYLSLVQFYGCTPPAQESSTSLRAIRAER